MKKRTKNETFRTGPHPLPIHLGMAAAAKSDIQEYVSQYAPLIGQEELSEIIRGIQLYQRHPYKVKRKKRTPVWSEGGACVYRFSREACAAIDSRRQPVLLVPSLVNTCDILNLCPERSLTQWLADRGHQTYLLDWGETSQYPQDKNIEGIVRGRLCAAIENIADQTGGPVTIVGYCMGGTLSMAAASVLPEKIGRIVLMAAPWDFHTRNQVLSERVRTWSPLVTGIIEERGYLPAEWTQALFATLDPSGSAKKFARFARMEPDSGKAKLFVAVEDWLNDGVNLAAEIATHCLQQWFARNAPQKGEWKISGRAVNLENIECPILIVASTGDHLVPYDAAACISESLSGTKAEIIRLDCGHISLIAGSKAIETVWTPIAEWMEC